MMMHNIIAIVHNVIVNVHNVPEHLSRPESLNSCVAGGSSSNHHHPVLLLVHLHLNEQV